MHRKISNICLIFLFFGQFLAFGAENKDIESKDSVKVVESEDQSILRKAIALPLRYTVQPVIEGLLYPTVPVVDYVFKEKVIDRAIDLFSLDKENKMMLFPTSNFLLAQGSFFGIYFLWKDAFFVPQNRWVVNYKYLINQDWRLKTDYSIRNLNNTDFSWKMGYRHKQYKNVFYTSPIEKSYDTHQDEFVEFYRSDSTYNGYGELSFALNSTQSIIVRQNIHQYNFKTPDAAKLIDGSSSTVSKLYGRKLYENYKQYLTELSWVNNTRESNYQSTYGVYRGLKLQLAQVEGGGDWIGFSGFLESFWLLGNKRYQLSREEDRQNKREYRRFSLKKAFNFLNPDQLTQFLSERKVIVSYLQFRQIKGLGDDRPPLTALNSSGWSTPLRGYSNNQLFSEGMLAWSLEYRWPIIQKLDGLFFNEYALPFENFESVNGDQIRNSWGFGFRVTKPNMFFLRMQIGFHGLNGYALTASISPTFP